jgi:hypothetical protein
MPANQPASLRCFSTCALFSHHHHTPASPLSLSPILPSRFPSLFRSLRRPLGPPHFRCHPPSILCCTTNVFYQLAGADRGAPRSILLSEVWSRRGDGQKFNAGRTDSSALYRHTQTQPLFSVALDAMTLSLISGLCTAFPWSSRA